jgi:hypothetical protein
VTRGQRPESPGTHSQVRIEVGRAGGGVEADRVPGAGAERQRGDHLAAPVTGEPVGDAEHVVAPAGAGGRGAGGRGDEQRARGAEAAQRVPERRGQGHREVAPAPLLVGDHRAAGGPAVGREGHGGRQVGALGGRERAAQRGPAVGAQGGAGWDRRVAAAAGRGQEEVDEGPQESWEHVVERRAGAARRASAVVGPVDDRGPRCRCGQPAGPDAAAGSGPIDDVESLTPSVCVAASLTGTPGPVSPGRRAPRCSTRPAPSSRRRRRPRAATRGRPGRRRASVGRAPPRPR